MPWESIDELPVRITEAIPSTDGRKRFLAAFNNCVSDGGDDEKCYAVAYGAAKKSSNLPVGKASVIAKARLPMWAWAVLQAEGFAIPQVKKSSVSLAEVKRLFSYAATQKVRGERHGLGAAPVYAEGIVAKLNNRELVGKALAAARDVLPGWAFATLRQTHTVAPAGDVVFVSKHELTPEAASLIEAVYVPLLGAPRFTIHAMDKGEPFAAPEHSVVVGLGKESRKLRPDAVLPHPEALVRFGDRGEVARKSYKIRKSIDAASILRLSLERVHRFKANTTDESAARSGDSIDSVLVPIVKAESSKQIVVGVVLTPWEEDSQGDVISAAEIEETAHNYLAKSGVIGVEHARKAPKAKAVESSLVPYPTKKDYDSAIKGEDHSSYRIAMGEDEVVSGAWVVSVKLPDDLWSAYQRGELSAFSIGGFGERADHDPASVPNVTYRKV